MANLRKYLGAAGVAWAACAPFAVLVLVGCGSSSKTERKEPDQGVSRSSGSSYKPGSRRLGDDDDRSHDGMALQNEQGVLEADDVESVLERNFRSFIRCYSRAGDAQRYVEGQVVLRFFVSGTGDVSDAHVIENTLGNFAIERCLVVEARAIKFPAPRGGKPTEFEYPLAFRSTREAAVVDWPESSVPIEIIDAIAAMHPCNPIVPSGKVETIVYIEPSGTVGSAGFHAEGAIDAEAAMCALEQIRSWRLRGEGGHVVRTRFDLRIPSEVSVRAAPAAPSTARGRKPKPRRR